MTRWPRHTPNSRRLLRGVSTCGRIEFLNVTAGKGTHGFAMIMVDPLLDGRPDALARAKSRTVPWDWSISRTAGVSPLNAAAAVATASCLVVGPDILSMSNPPSPPQVHSILVTAPPSDCPNSSRPTGFVVGMASMMQRG